VRFAAFLPLFFAPDFAAFLAPPFFAALRFAAPPFFAALFLAPFFAPVFFAAMLVSWECEQVLALGETLYDAAQDTIHSGARNRENRERESDFPSEKCDWRCEMHRRMAGARSEKRVQVASRE
jgi:hypothetical protein